MKQAKLQEIPEVTPDFSFEDEADGIVCGIDEVGRGPLAGPVVAAAVVLRRAFIPLEILAEINDSKKVPAEKRGFLFKELQKYAYIALAECSVGEIDRINILQASLRAMRKAHMKLHKIMGEAPPVMALVDGNVSPRLAHRIKIKTIVQGDARSFSIAAASIVAKHYRDTLMKKYARKFPQYGWHTNVGYGTAEHLEALEMHGITPLHRRSFAPVSKQLVKQSSANN